MAARSAAVPLKPSRAAQRGQGRGSRIALLAMLGALVAAGSAAPSTAVDGAVSEVEIAVAASLSGSDQAYAEGILLGAQLAVEQANADGSGPKITVVPYDDEGSSDKAREIAGDIAASDAAVVIGPAFSTFSLEAGPVYAQAGLVDLPATATSDLITDSPTTFRILFKNSDQGEALAVYLSRVLGYDEASVVLVDDVYGNTLKQGFEATAGRLDIEAEYYAFDTIEEAEAIAEALVEEAPDVPVVFMTLDVEAAAMLAILIRNGAQGPFLGGDGIGNEALNAHFGNEPEEAQDPGFFTENLYGIAPVFLDSANAETLAFADTFRARFGEEPDWQAVAGYDAALAAIAAAESAARTATDVVSLRKGVFDYLLSLDSPEHAIPGLLGPIWFDETRSREMAIRMGRFSAGEFDSAPVQLVPVTLPDETELASGAVFETRPGRYARIQRVVYTGVYINEIARVDLPRSSFTADFYLWMRFATQAGPDSLDPTEITFPSLVSGNFDLAAPSEARSMPDGTEYRLWRIQGEFRNDFDLHRYPFDDQSLSLSFFHARGDLDRIVYVIDRRAQNAAGLDGPDNGLVGGAAAEAALTDASGLTLSTASPDAFRNLTQWSAKEATSRRDNLVTASPLGDPARVGVVSSRELSGFLVSIDIERRSLATLGKTLVPLALLTLIMFASLHFPVALVKEKIAVAITGALSGAVLLTAINNQLGGNIGYTIIVEYVFYAFFFLSLLAIMSVLGGEKLRAAGRSELAMRSETAAQLVFLATVAVTMIALAVIYKTS